MRGQASLAVSLRKHTGNTNFNANVIWEADGALNKHLADELGRKVTSVTGE